MIIIHIGIQIYHVKDSAERGIFSSKYRFFFFFIFFFKFYLVSQINYEKKIGQ